MTDGSAGGAVAAAEEQQKKATVASKRGVALCTAGGAAGVLWHSVLARG